LGGNQTVATAVPATHRCDAPVCVRHCNVGTLCASDSSVAAATQRDANTLHRIDEASVKSEIEAAGFRLEGESDLLYNAGDPRTANVKDPTIRGKTDQFILEFRKPKQ
jgi:predicted methyltransferase